MRFTAHQYSDLKELMFDKAFLPARRFRVLSAAALGLALAVLGGGVFAAQDKYTLRVPDGLAFSDFRGYENWQVVAVVRLRVAQSDGGQSHNDRRLPGRHSR